ncbi:MAG: hypothetical protein DRJ63_04000 [Thermoprotei archaeon]|nr:MAG: hypothetical protein DRJ63_04000 [Thermoprotei archaeon]
MKYDVVICGGGLAGVAAAIASAKMGCATLLVEQYGYLGGCATLGLVNPFMKYYVNDRVLAGTIFAEILSNLRSEEGCWGKYCQFFDPEILKGVLFDLCEKYGVEVLLYSKFLRAKVRDSHIEYVELALKEGAETAKGLVFIDATGDGDLAVSAGAPWEYGDGEVAQPMTLMFRIGGIDFKKMLDYLKKSHDYVSWVSLERLESFIEKNQPFSFAGFSKLIKIYRKDFPDIPAQNQIFLSTCIPSRGEAFANLTRVQMLSGLYSRDLTKATVVTYRQARSIVNFLRKHVPGFEKCYLLETAPIIGVRETRRIIGEYVLKAEDIISARKFEDAVAAGCYPIDIHPMRPSDKETIMLSPPPGDYYEIPYRCLVPLKVTNLLITGRCISATHEAQAAIRIMPIVCYLGEASGYAASLSVEKEGLVRKIDVNTLQKLLKIR